MDGSVSLRVDAFGRLREAKKMISQHSNPRIPFALPAEDLTGIQRGGEIVVAHWEENFTGRIHFQITYQRHKKAADNFLPAAFEKLPFNKLLCSADTR